MKTNLIALVLGAGVSLAMFQFGRVYQRQQDARFLASVWYVDMIPATRSGDTGVFFYSEAARRILAYFRMDY